MLEKRPLVCFTDIDGKYVVLGGNMRLKAANEVGLKQLPILLADDWTEEQKNEFLIKDNVGFGEWDWEQIKNDWDVEKLDEWGLDVPDFAETVLEAEEDEFDVPEGGIETDIVLGDLFEIGEHRLLCGDSTDSDQVAKLMNGQKADMVFTDPPYGVDYEGINNDDRGGLEDLLRGAFGNMMVSTNNGGSFYCFHSDKCSDIFSKVYREFCHFSSMIIWVKESIVLSQTDYQSKHEPCMYGWFDNGTHKWYSDRKQESVWIAKSKREEGHTTPKPIDIITKALNNSSKVGMSVLDLFLGSGSTMVASHQLKRKCYGMELDCKYVEVIVQRMIKLDKTLIIKRNGIDETKKWLNKLG
jgi:DNA modification methylase